MHKGTRANHTAPAVCPLRGASVSVTVGARPPQQPPGFFLCMGPPLQRRESAARSQQKGDGSAKRILPKKTCVSAPSSAPSLATLWGILWGTQLATKLAERPRRRDCDLRNSLHTRALDPLGALRTAPSRSLDRRRRRQVCRRLSRVAGGRCCGSLGRAGARRCRGRSGGSTLTRGG
eukprot:gene21127-biopygen19164